MISSQMPNWAEVVTALVSCGALIAVVLAAVQIRHMNQQMHRDFEMQYLTKFWEIMDRRSDRFKLTGRMSRSDRAVINDYLVLTEDQISLRRLGRVTDHTWSYWRVDIKSMCSSDPARRILDSHDSDQFVLIRELLNSTDYDPLEMNRAKRAWLGL